MNRRKLILGIGSAASAGALTFGSSAFSFGEVERDAAVGLTGDDSALLEFNATSDYASINSDGLLELDFTADGTGGHAINPGGTFGYEGVFEITNQGDRDVDLRVANTQNSHGQIDELNLFDSSNGYDKSRNYNDNGLSGSAVAANVGTPVEIGVEIVAAPREDFNGSAVEATITKSILAGTNGAKFNGTSINETDGNTNNSNDGIFG